MPYIHFTEEQIYRANSVNLEHFLQMQGEKLLPSGRDKRLASDGARQRMVRPRFGGREPRH